jgi:hypothetical protein
MPATRGRTAPARTVIPVAAAPRTVIRRTRVIPATDDNARLNDRRTAVIAIARIVVDTRIAAAIGRRVRIDRATAKQGSGRREKNTCNRGFHDLDRTSSTITV